MIAEDLESVLEAVFSMSGCVHPDDAGYWEDLAARLQAPPSVWAIMQNDSPIGVAFSETEARYQADSARYQYPYLARRRWIDTEYPLRDWHVGPHFHIRGPFTAGKLSAL